jgi:hypothetical protein
MPCPPPQCWQPVCGCVFFAPATGILTTGRGRSPHL